MGAWGRYGKLRPVRQGGRSMRHGQRRACPSRRKAGALVLGEAAQQEFDRHRTPDEIALDVAAAVAAGRLEAKPARVFRFEEIREAHRVMEANEAGGKMVVVHG